MFKYASLIGAGLLACGVSQQAQATSVAYTLDFFYGANNSQEVTGQVVLNYSSIAAAENPANTIVNYQGTSDTSTFVSLVTSDFSYNGKDYGSFNVNGPSSLASGYFLDIGANGTLYGLTVNENGLLLSYSLDTSQNNFSIHSGGSVQGGTDLYGSVTVAAGPYTVTPLPAGLPLVAGGLGLVGWFSRGRKQKAALTA